MRNHYHVLKAQLEKVITLITLLCIACFLPPSQAQSLKIIVTGTGQTTGQIATLSIINTTGSTVRINAQTCYIPSQSSYQPYVATIPEATVPPGTTNLKIDGYCANVHAYPVPDGEPMPRITDWIPIKMPDTKAPPSGTNILTSPEVAAFTSDQIPDLIKAPGYTPHSTPSTSTMMPTWPNTTTTVEGTINAEAYPVTFAPVMVEAVNTISKSFDALKLSGRIQTPFSSNPKKEREAVIQHTFWLYTAQITGSTYSKEQFHEKVIRVYEDNTDSKADKLSKEELEKLTSGIEVFWNTFVQVGIDAKVLKATSPATGSYTASNTLLPPWDKIELTDVRMKPGHKNAQAFPWLPVVGGTVAAGALVYLLTADSKEADTVDCAFTASAMASNSTCGQSNGSVTLTVIPAGAYSYQWSNGSTSPSVNNVPAGIYTVTITRTGTSCSQVVSATVTNQQLSFNASLTSKDTDCGQATGAITVTPSPPGTYTYLWSNGSTSQNQTNLSAGNYTVTISAGGNCQKVLSAQIGTAPFEPTVTFTTTPSTCGGSDGAAQAIVNPAGTYAYAWSNGQSGSSVSGLSAGSYQVTVSKPGTPCSYVASVTVNDLSASFTVSVASTMSGCGMSNGTATATVDPPGTYAFTWSNGQTGPQASGLAGGTYTVTVSLTGTSCTQEESVTITEQPANFVVTMSSTPAGCGLTDGTATATVNPPGNYTYLWSNGQSGAQLSGLAPGTYTVTVAFEGQNCVKQGTTTVGSTPFPYTISFTTTPATCGGSDGTSTVILTPQGEANYQWSNGQTGSQLSGVKAGTYTVTVTVPGTNCTSQSTTTIEELPAAFIVSTTTTPAGCGMSNGTATATVDLPGNYTYTWSNGQTGSQLSGVASGSYTVTVSITGTSCSKTATATISQLPPTFMLSFQSTPAGCGMNNGSASVQVTPPGSYTYLWSNGATGTQITNVGAGDYTVTVTVTGTSCSASGMVHVGQTGGGFTATFTTTNADCGVPNGSATVTVSPPGEYTYVWSNQQTGNKLEQVGPGTYMVTVTNTGGCSESFSVTIGQNIAEYINILSTTPGTCAGGGDIRFTLTTPGAGPLVLQVTGPQGNNMFTSGPGVFNLSAFMTVIPGMYTIMVTDQQIGPSCSETVSATVADNTPPIVLEDDFYSAEGTNPVNGNALTNDEGLSLTMTQVDNEIGGTVSFMADGDFTFIAEIGFTGNASFVYTATDACGTTSTAVVNIDVNPVPCDIDVSFVSTPASCGLEDGSITVIVNGPGDYAYEWDNGDSGPTIEDIPPGGYAVTITDTESGCIYEDTYILEGSPGNYIENVVVIQPDCESDGDIQFTAMSPSGNNLNMLVEHPFGGADFEIEPGLIVLSDYVTTVPGEYFVEVSDPDAGPGCSESFMVTINPPPVPGITVVEIFPPSGPGAMDGSAFVEVTTPGHLPYAVYVDGLFAFTVNQNNFFLLGLSSGVHTVYLVDIQGCQSNTVQFVVPAGQQAFSLGIGITDAGPNHTSNEQPNGYQPEKVWQTVLSGSYRFDVGPLQQMVRVVYAPGLRMHTGITIPGFMAMEYLSGPKDLQWKGIGLRAQMGIGTSTTLQHETAVAPEGIPIYGILRASAERRIFERVMLSASISLRGFGFTYPVSWELGARMPFYTWKQSGGGG